MCYPKIALLVLISNIFLTTPAIMEKVKYYFIAFATVKKIINVKKYILNF